MPDAEVIVSDIQLDAQKYIPEGTQDTTIIGTLALQQNPIEKNGSTIYSDVSALLESKTKGDFFRRYSITVISGSMGRQVTQVTFSDTPLSEFHFQIDAGLISREVVLEDPDHHMTILYPIGVGGIDPAVEDPTKTSLLTPLFENGVLKRKTVISHRSYPTYYRNLPFMPITTDKGVQTDIGFHISILSDGDWANKGGQYLVRGFDSHGCMRLREKDLNEFYTIVKKGGSEELPVNVNYFIYNRGSDGHREEQYGELAAIGAYPIFGNYYQSVTNFGTADHPIMRRDPKEHLEEMGKIYRSPDPVLAQLTGLTEEQKQDLIQFEDMIRDADFGPLEPPKTLAANSKKKTEKS
jgi:hypothetical protein